MLCSQKQKKREGTDFQKNKHQSNKGDADTIRKYSEVRRTVVEWLVFLPHSTSVSSSIPGGHYHKMV